MSNLFSRACTMFVVFGALGIGACASPSGPGAISSSGNQTPGAELGQPSARAVASGLTESSAISPGVTDVTLANTGWTCRAPTPRQQSAHLQAWAFLRGRPFPIMEEHRVTPSGHSTTTSSTIA